MRSIRVVTLNLWNDRSEPNRRLEVIVEGLRGLQPDVVALQEVVETSEGNQAETIARALGGEVHFDVVDATNPARRCGNAIVSRVPIGRMASVALPSAPDDPRRAQLCELLVPAGTLPFVTCHLSWEMWHSPRREDQVVALDRFVRAHRTDLPPILCGDFNASPDASSIRFLTGRTSLAGAGAYYRDCFARRHPDAHGYTFSAKNPYAVRWIERNRRIDYVFVGPLREDGWGAVLDARVVLDIPGPDGIYASDHFGVYAEIGLAKEGEAV